MWLGYYIVPFQSQRQIAFRGIAFTASQDSLPQVKWLTIGSKVAGNRVPGPARDIKLWLSGVVYLRMKLFLVVYDSG